MRLSILFPGDYFSLNSVNDNFTFELGAAVSCSNLSVALFNFDEFIEGAPLKLNKPAKCLPRDLLYRGWMMKPELYKRFYEELRAMGFNPIVKPEAYEATHLFPNASIALGERTPKNLAFPAQSGKVCVDAEEINNAFDRFMLKDYVKSLKDTSFPTSFETPITQEDLDACVSDFIERRGSLFTGGIVFKEFVELKRYSGATNEWRQFFKDGLSVGLCRNSNQPSDCPAPSESILTIDVQFHSSFYTVDYAELNDGDWKVIEVGDGQVSGLAAADSPARFYEELNSIVMNID